MKAPSPKKHHGQTPVQPPNHEKLMRQIKQGYRAAGATEQEIAAVQSAAGNPPLAALVIALIIDRIEEDKLSRARVSP